MARPAFTYRGARRTIARQHKLLWGKLKRVQHNGVVVVQLPAKAHRGQTP